VGQQRINVTKSFMPPIEEYQALVAQIWDAGVLTNHGPLLQQFEARVGDHLGLSDSHLHYVSNGTMALQLALRALDITDGEIITTPFSYVATVSSILWERCTPVFVDIEPDMFGIDPNKIEAAITERTRAIMPVHVFGVAADVGAIGHIAAEHNLKVIYDGAHAFGSELMGRSLLGFGDITTTSFHATKPFHTIEGGAVITRDPEVHERLELLKRFGHIGDNHQSLGINAKTSEFNAAMGLVNLRYIDDVLAARTAVVEHYDALLDGSVRKPILPGGLKHNSAYYPVLFDSEALLLEAIARLEAIDVFPRRYFYPSLNTLSYLPSTQACPISEDIASRILCLPLYPDLHIEDVCRIAEACNATTPSSRRSPRMRVEHRTRSAVVS
jgi:dTDP-4-amino-4,6-dideoxygalactose transaminase